MAKAKRKTLPTNFTEILETGSFEEQKAVFDSCALDAYERGYSHERCTMAKAKRKTLPTNFTEILETGSFEEQKAVFDSCALDAYERGYSHDTALHQYAIKEELARYLVSQGLNINTQNAYGRFDSCALDAYERGYSHDTALHQYAIKEELARYLVSQGLNINTQNAYGRTPLYTHSTVGAPLVAVLLELGADVNLANNDGCTPLFTALANARVDTVKLLLEHGADIKHKNQAKQSALEYGLSLTSNASIPDMLQCSKLMLDAGLKVTKNMQKSVKAIGDNFERYREGLSLTSNASIPDMLQCSKLMLDAGLKVTKNMQKSVKAIGDNFERYREAFNKDLLATTDAALTELYKLFDVEPAAKHITHDGTQSITITGNTPQEQFNNLWDLLVPPQGPAKTVQGEVIRIAGRVRSEFYRNGGANWDREYRSMLNTLIKHLGTHNALSDDDLARAKDIAHSINGKADFDETILVELSLLALTWVSHNLDTHNALSDDDLARAKDIAHSINGKADFDETILVELSLLALTWVSHNLDPIALKTPAYKR